MYCPDNYDFFCEHEARQEEMLSRMPVCDACGDEIQDEHLFEVNGEKFCLECAKVNFMKYTEDYMRG